MAGTGLDEHHFPFHDLSIGALELHGEGGCSVGCAAAPVSADTTELSSVRLHAGAARQLKLDGLGDFWGANALFAFLDVLLQVSFARSDHAQSALLLQSAESIIIGDPGRDAHATGLGASTPLSSLHQAIGTHHGGVWAVSVFQSVGGQCGSHRRLLLGLVADPLLTALAGELHPPRVGAVRAGQADVHAAEGHAAHRAVQAGALVLAAALEGLAAPVHHAGEDAGRSVPSGADADAAVGGGAEVAEEPFVVVAGVALGAQLAQLLGADAAAAAAIEHQGDAGGAAGAGPRAALALPAALLAAHLRAEEGEQQGDGEAGGGHPGVAVRCETRLDGAQRFSLRRLSAARCGAVRVRAGPAVAAPLRFAAPEPGGSSEPGRAAQFPPWKFCGHI